MCLLFFNINESAKDDELSLILANNRDEYWMRPTKAADFWNSDRTCISGLDQEPGREGGTWFGANVYGRIGCLVNISTQQDLSKKGRGFLVSDFLTTTETIDAYAERIAAEKDAYNGFTLTLIQIVQGNGSRVVRVTNDKLSEDAVFHHNRPSSDDFFAIGNSPIKHPWRKISYGKEQFTSIVQEHRHVSTKQQLEDKLFQMMADKTRYLPDGQLQKQGEECGWKCESINSKSAVCVWDPANKYATRTTTLLLMDGKGNCSYTERTLLTPVDLDSPQWSTVQHMFTLQSPHTAEARLSKL